MHACRLAGWQWQRALAAAGLACVDGGRRPRPVHQQRPGGGARQPLHRRIKLSLRHSTNRRAAETEMCWVMIGGSSAENATRVAPDLRRGATQPSTRPPVRLPAGSSAPSGPAPPPPRLPGWHSARQRGLPHLTRPRSCRHCKGAGNSVRRQVCEEEGGSSERAAAVASLYVPM